MSMPTKDNEKMSCVMCHQTICYVPPRGRLSKNYHSSQFQNPGREAEA